MSTITLRLNDDLRKRLKKLADSNGRSAHALMRIFIEQGIEEQENREMLFRLAIASYERYEITGLHVESEEVWRWFHKLKNSPKAKPPECKK